MRNGNPPTDHHRRHPSSYGMQDPDVVFAALGLRPGDVFLDAGCGRGEYALEAARRVGPGGAVHALDLDAGCVSDLERAAGEQGLAHLRARMADLARGLPLPDASVSVALLAMVLHVPALARTAEAVLAEVRRVLRPGGRLGIMSCRPDAAGGPPPPRPLAPDRVAATLEGLGFRALGVTDLGIAFLAVAEKPRAE